MNRLLFRDDELSEKGELTISDRRADHLRRVLHAQVGDTLRVGMLNGALGTGCVTEITAEQITLAVTLQERGPEPWIDLLLAPPRPKVLKRLWPQLAAIGVGRIILLNASRVESYYFATHWMEERHYRPLLLEGLEQAGTTYLPEVWLRRAFKPFVEDELDLHYGDALKFLAHPSGTSSGPPPWQAQPRPLLAIGPEGGWSAYELAKLAEHDFLPCSLSHRTLRSDTACMALLGMLLLNVA